MGNPANVISGVGRLFVAPLDTAVPTTAGSWPAGWVDVGYTYGGIAFEYTPDFFEKEVDQEMSPVGVDLIGENFICTVNLAEATLENLNRVISGIYASETTSKSLSFGSAVSYPVTMIGMQGDAPGGGIRTVIIHHAQTVGEALMTDKAMQLRLVTAEWISLGQTEIWDGDRPSEAAAGVIVNYNFTAGGSSTKFDLPEKIYTGSDPIVAINGVIQDPEEYTVTTGATYTSITFDFTPEAQDYISVWYQKGEI